MNIQDNPARQLNCINFVNATICVLNHFIRSCYLGRGYKQYIHYLCPTRLPFQKPQLTVDCVANMKLAISFLLLNCAVSTLATYPFFPRQHPDIRPANRFSENFLNMRNYADTILISEEIQVNHSTSHHTLIVVILKLEGSSQQWQTPWMAQKMTHLRATLDSSQCGQIHTCSSGLLRQW